MTAYLPILGARPGRGLRRRRDRDRLVDHPAAGTGLNLRLQGSGAHPGGGFGDGNFARVIAWRRAVDWRAVAWYALPGMPAAALGARTLLALPPAAIDLALGVFLWMIPLRHRHARSRRRLAPWHLAIAGALIGYITGIVLSTGPLSVPVFAAYGLVGGAFLSTEAASSMTLDISKVIAFRGLGAMPGGLIVGCSLMAGTYCGKAVVGRMRPDAFRYLLDAVMLVSGIALIWRSVTAA